MSRSERAKLYEQARRKLQRLSGVNRFVPMWTRLHVYKKNPVLYGPGGELLDTSHLAEQPSPAIPDYEVPRLFGGLWDTRYQCWDPDATGPEKAEDLTVFPCSPA